MLDLGACRWDHIVLGISVRSHVDAATLRLERMDAAWPEGEEHMAKLSVNAMMVLWGSTACAAAASWTARARTSLAFAYEGGMVWTSSTPEGAEQRHLPPHPRRGLGFEHCMVAKARRILDAPPYLAQVKTDCLLTQRLPKRFTERLWALEALRNRTARRSTA